MENGGTEPCWSLYGESDSRPLCAARHIPSPDTARFRPPRSAKCPLSSGQNIPPCPCPTDYGIRQSFSLAAYNVLACSQSESVRPAISANPPHFGNNTPAPSLTPPDCFLRHLTPLPMPRVLARILKPIRETIAQKISSTFSCTHHKSCKPTLLILPISL